MLSLPGSAAQHAQVASTIMFSRDLQRLRADDILRAFETDASGESILVHVSRKALMGQTLATALHSSGLAKSRTEARRAITADSAASINGNRVVCRDPRQLPTIKPSDLLEGKLVVLGLGTARRVVVVA